MLELALIGAVLASTLSGTAPAVIGADAGEETVRLVELVQQPLGPLYPLPVYQKCDDPKFPWVHQVSMTNPLPDGVSFLPTYSEPLLGGMTAVYGLMTNWTVHTQPVAVWLRCTSDVSQAQTTRLP